MKTNKRERLGTEFPRKCQGFELCSPIGQACISRSQDECGSDGIVDLKKDVITIVFCRLRGILTAFVVSGLTQSSSGLAGRSVLFLLSTFAVQTRKSAFQPVEILSTFVAPIFGVDPFGSNDDLDFCSMHITHGI
jgi:hypothetical protein